jgi:Ca2+-binding RTX toxin-like protein
MSGSTTAAASSNASAYGVAGYSTQWTETFDSGLGGISHTWGHVWVHDGMATVSSWASEGWQPSGMMQPPSGVLAGQGFGLYSVTLDINSYAPGAFACLWPGSDVWPGPELDLIELDFNGNAYSTIHWKGANGADEFKSYAIAGIDARQVHTYSFEWASDHMSLYVDGALKWTTTEHVPQDAAHGGENSAFGVGQQPAWAAGYQAGDNSVDVHEMSYAAPVAPGTGGGGTSPVTGLVLAGTPGADRQLGAALADSLSGQGGNDTQYGYAGADTIDGGDGQDYLFGGAGDDVLKGGAGNDVLRGEAGNDVIATGAGIDRVLFGTGGGNDVVTDFALGTDRVNLTNVTTGEVTASVATVGGVSGLKLSLAGGESLFLQGVGAVAANKLGLAGSFASGSAAPSPYALVAGTVGDDWLKGGSGADSLSGGAGSDDLQGLGGNDMLRGGTGDDGLTGGAGADIFVFGRGDGVDWVVDFTPGTDDLRLEGIAAGQVTQTVTSAWGMAGLALDFGSGDSVFLQGVTQALAASDFVFG